MPRRTLRGRPWWWSALGGTTVACLAAAGLTVDHLQAAGLAFPAVVIAVALGLGVPLARRDWLEAEDRKSPVYATMSKMAIWGSVAALATVNGTEPREIAVLASAFLITSFLGDSRATLLAGVALFGPLVQLGLPAVAYKAPPGWEVLEPTLVGWRTWLTPAVFLGLLLGWGPSFWSATAAPAPGRTNLAYLTAGVGGLAMLATTWLLAALHHAGLGSVPALGLGFMTSLTAGVALVQQYSSARERLASFGLFLLFALYFWMSGLQELWWALIGPVLLAAAAVLQCIRTRRLVWGAVGVGLLAVLLVARSTYPQSLMGGFYAALPLVGALWIGGTRALETTP